MGGRDITVKYLILLSTVQNKSYIQHYVKKNKQALNLEPQTLSQLKLLVQGVVKRYSYKKLDQEGKACNMTTIFRNSFQQF